MLVELGEEVGDFGFVDLLESKHREFVVDFGQAEFGAELAPAFASQSDLERWLDPAVFERLPLPYSAGWLAAQAFLKYRKAGGHKSSPLPDFYIGAHAASAGLTLVTRDAARYQTYFPSVPLITP